MQQGMKVRHNGAGWMGTVTHTYANGDFKVVYTNEPNVELFYAHDDKYQFSIDDGMTGAPPAYIESATGMLKQGGKLHVELVPVDWNVWLAEGMQYGAYDKKPKAYGELNWALGGKASIFISAALRHIYRVMRGEWLDPESGKAHLVHAAMNCLMLVSLHECNKLENDLEKYRGK